MAPAPPDSCGWLAVNAARLAEARSSTDKARLRNMGSSTDYTPFHRFLRTRRGRVARTAGASCRDRRLSRDDSDRFSRLLRLQFPPLWEDACVSMQRRLPHSGGAMKSV